MTGDISFAIESLRERHKRQQAEEMLHKALQESQWRQTEVSALLEGSRAVLEYRGLPDAARAIFDSCKNLIGATGGYIALLSADETENEVLLLDTGGLPCHVDPSLPMPIRGLRGEVYGAGQVMYENNFSESKWPQYMPEGHVKLDNIEVIDNGIGIPEDIVEYVFDPFFTTKGPDRGTGLGLSISRSIVEGFGGTIYINSTPGSGTTATISLPVEQSRSQ